MPDLILILLLCPVLAALFWVLKVQGDQINALGRWLTDHSQEITALRRQLDRLEDSTARGDRSWAEDEF